MPCSPFGPFGQFAPYDTSCARCSPQARAAALRNRQQAQRNQALFCAGALPGLRRLSAQCGCSDSCRSTAGADSSCTAGARTQSAAQELYAPRIADIETSTCCDSFCGCRTFDRSQRSCYWPSYCHPRWLTCDELYCRRR